MLIVQIVRQLLRMIEAAPGKVGRRTPLPGHSIMLVNLIAHERVSYASQARWWSGALLGLYARERPSFNGLDSECECVLRSSRAPEHPVSGRLTPDSRLALYADRDSYEGHPRLRIRLPRSGWWRVQLRIAGAVSVPLQPRSVAGPRRRSGLRAASR